tara:strand:- start:158 stop:310 length:153 start_codon:yes stop_codon:yes gene_type:complete
VGAGRGSMERNQNNRNINGVCGEGEKGFLQKDADIEKKEIAGKNRKVVQF